MTVRNAVLIYLIVEAGLGVLGIINYGYTVEGLQATTRFSGRFSLLLFSIIFLANRPANMYPWLSKKPFHIFAMAHGIHLLELLTFLYVSGSEIIPYRVAGGFIAYALIFLMPFLADRREHGKLEEKKFKILTIVFQYFVKYVLMNLNAYMWG